MIQCSHCQHMVDTTGRTTCPVCFAVLPPSARASGVQPPVSRPPAMPVGVAGAPAANYGGYAPAVSAPVTPGYTPPPGSPYAAPPPPMIPMPPIQGAGGMPVGGRVTLTGEVIPDAMPRPMPPGAMPGGYGGYGQAGGPGLPSGMPVPSAPLPPSYRTPSGRNSGMSGINVVAIVSSVVVSALIGIQAVQHGGSLGFHSDSTPTAIVAAQSDPRSTAENVYRAFMNRDWHRVFYFSVFSIGDSKTEQNADAFARGVEHGMDQNRAQSEEVLRLIGSLTEVQMGTPLIMGDHADVPTAAKVHMEGDSFELHGHARLLMRNNRWYWDLTGDVAETSAALFGDPGGFNVSRRPRFLFPRFTPFGGGGPGNIPDIPHPEIPPPSIPPPHYYQPHFNQPNYYPPQIPRPPMPSLPPRPYFGPGNMPHGPFGPGGPNGFGGPRFGPNGFGGPRFGPGGAGGSQAGQSSGSPGGADGSGETGANGGAPVGGETAPGAPGGPAPGGAPVDTGNGGGPGNAGNP